LHHKGKCIFIGEFDTATKAAVMRDEVVQFLGGEYAQYNFPQEQRVVSADSMRQVARVQTDVALQ